LYFGINMASGMDEKLISVEVYEKITWKNAARPLNLDLSKESWK